MCAAMQWDIPSTPVTRSGAHHRQQRGEDTVRRVLDVVEQILDEGGEPALRLADVSKRSGVSIGSLYHHFESREGLIQAAREDQFLQGLTDDAASAVELLEASTSKGELIEGVRRLIRSTQSAARAPNRLRRVELIGAATSRPDLLDAIREKQTMVLDAGEMIAREFARRGLLKEGVDPRTLSLLLQAITLGRVLGDLDAHGVDEDLWAEHVERAIGGLVDLSGPE